MNTHHENATTPSALVTGASRGLGLALTRALVADGWHVIGDARDGTQLSRALAPLRDSGSVTLLSGDVSDPVHRLELAEVAAQHGHLDLLVNNASVLGPSPQPHLSDYPLVELERVLAVNTLAPLALTQLVLPLLDVSRGSIVNVSSDAAVEAYEGWGGYGCAKAALDQLTAVLAVERPALRVYAFDPGDMATDLQQQAFPGEDVTDRPSPESVVPVLLRLIAGSAPSGRYQCSDLAAAPVRA